MKAVGKDNIAVTVHDTKKGYIKLMTDSKGISGTLGMITDVISTVFGIY